MAGTQSLLEKANVLLTSIQPQVHPEVYRIVSGLFQVREIKIALEHLCELLAEDGVSLGGDLHERLIEMVVELRLDRVYVEMIPPPDKIDGNETEELPGKKAVSPKMVQGVG